MQTAILEPQTKKELRAYYYLAWKKYGIVPLVLARMHFESVEMYEQCTAITDVLNSASVQNKVHIPSFKNKKEARVYYKEEFYDLGYSGDTASANLDSYVEEIIKDVPKF